MLEPPCPSCILGGVTGPYCGLHGEAACELLILLVACALLQPLRELVHAKVCIADIIRFKSACTPARMTRHVSALLTADTQVVFKVSD